ncbi:MAG: capsid cement protein [Nocardioides sp.]
MAVERFTGSQTDAKPSATDLTGKEFFLATRVPGGFTLAGAGAKVAGVISEGKAVGLHSSVKTGNQLKAVAGAAIAVGDTLASDAAGKAVPAGAGASGFGVAMSAAANGEMVTFDMSQTGPA